jgi:predicted  nucleic acid-binding Zn-ribbon protein
MTRDQQIAILQARLDDVNNSIAQLESALAAATDSATRSDLSAQISQLQQTAETLRTMINNLSGSAAAFDMIASPAEAKSTARKHMAVMIKSAKSSASDSHKRAVETIGLMKMPKGVKRPPAKLGK